MCFEWDAIFEGKYLIIVLTTVMQIISIISGINNSIPDSKRNEQELLLFVIHKCNLWKVADWQVWKPNSRTANGNASSLSHWIYLSEKFLWQSKNPKAWSFSAT